MELTKPGDLCSQRLKQGYYLTGVCHECRHLRYLHSSDRPCAACEAIAEAIKASISASTKAIAEAITVGKQMLA